MSVFQPRNKHAKKLTVTQVAEIRRYYSEGATQGELCRHFGVSIGQIGRIVRGESWVEGALERAKSPDELDEMAERLLKHQARVAANGSQTAEEMAKEFQAMLKEPADVGPVTRRPPPSPLDGGDAPSEAGGEGLSALEEKARAYGVDIEKLRSVK